MRRLLLGLSFAALCLVMSAITLAQGTVPNAPINLRAGLTAPGIITLTWEQTGDVDGWVIERLAVPKDHPRADRWRRLLLRGQWTPDMPQWEVIAVLPAEE